MCIWFDKKSPYIYIDSKWNRYWKTGDLPDIVDNLCNMSFILVHKFRSHHAKGTEVINITRLYTFVQRYSAVQMTNHWQVLRRWAVRYFQLHCLKIKIRTLILLLYFHLLFSYNCFLQSVFKMTIYMSKSFLEFN